MYVYLEIGDSDDPAVMMLKDAPNLEAAKGFVAKYTVEGCPIKARPATMDDVKAHVAAGYSIEPFPG